MSAKYILTQYAKETGQPITSSSQRANSLVRINEVAKELWDSQDLPGSLVEQVFDMDFTLKEITLPYYVDQVRGVRHYNSRTRVKANDTRPRYHTNAWTQPLLSFRIKQIIPIGHSITNEAPLTVELSDVNSEEFSVYIKMSTSTRTSVVEKVTFPSGTTSAITVNAPTSFPGIKNIEKDRVTDVDLVVKDSNGVVLAAIANNELQSRYTLIQVVDETVIFVQTDPCYELLYKVSFSPFFNDYDVFPVEKYDDIIIWKSVENFWKKKPGGKEQADAARATVAKLMADKAANSEAGEELEINFGTNRFHDVMSGGFPTGLYNDIPYRII